MDIKSATEKISLNSPGKQAPGGFGRRLVASLLDSLIVSIALFPINFVLALLAIAVFGKDSMVVTFITYPFHFLAVYFYFGYFYSQKGASLGKMVMNLRVINSDTGKNLSYKEAFFREVFGKLISGIPLLMGYIVVLFRDDRKGFHDQIFHTQVLHQES